MLSDVLPPAAARFRLEVTQLLLERLHVLANAADSALVLVSRAMPLSTACSCAYVVEPGAEPPVGEVGAAFCVAVDDLFAALEEAPEVDLLPAAALGSGQRFADRHAGWCCGRRQGSGALGGGGAGGRGGGQGLGERGGQGGLWVARSPVWPPCLQPPHCVCAAMNPAPLYTHSHPNGIVASGKSSLAYPRGPCLP